MLHVFEAWKLTQDRPRTIAAVQRVVMQFRELNGQTPVENVTRQHARDYRDMLIERQLSKGTVENSIGFLSTLVRFGMQEMVEELTASPFERIPVRGAAGVRVPKDRRAYELRELNHLFSSRLYTEAYRPEGQVGDAAYWVPLLGPLAGPRIEEACQLRVADVQRINGAWSIRICGLEDDQNVKTYSSVRRVGSLGADVAIAGGDHEAVAVLAPKAVGQERDKLEAWAEDRIASAESKPSRTRSSSSRG